METGSRNDLDVPVSDDSLYLKQYVMGHPDNKMAWYLLGKQYLAQGKTAKANYCFVQSGEVFEAFEKEPHPLFQAENPLEDERTTAADKGKKQTERHRKTRKWMLATVLLLLLFMMQSNSQVDEQQQSAASLSESNTVDQSSDVIQPNKTPEDGTAEGTVTNTSKTWRIHVVFGKRSSAAWQQVTDQLIAPVDTERKQGLLVAQLQQSGKYVLWNKQAPLLLAAEPPDDAGAVTIRYLDPDVCQCSVQDTTKQQQRFLSWSAEQEQRLVMRSAYAYYKQMNQAVPKSAEGLVGDYPNNSLPGLTPVMKQTFQQLSAMDAGNAASGSGANSAAVNGGSTAGGLAAGADSALAATISPAALNTDFLTEPLRIVVDKKNHRLAVISGDIIIRNYLVGLGGSKTPKGSFKVTEKVRNPNGKSTGAFGSRGMTLSDSLYAIHGTDEPETIGLDKSKGCIRMSKQDVEELFDLVPLGTPVLISEEVLPDLDVKPAQPFKLTPSNKETNNKKVYRWLD